MQTVKKSDKCEIRIGKSDFGKVPSIDVREFVVYNGEMGPTKKGFLIPEELWTDFVEAVNAYKVDDDEGSASKYLYVVTRSKSESHVTKKALSMMDIGAEPEAEPKMPRVKLDGYYLVKCRIKGGNVVSFKRIAKSENGVWNLYK